MEKWAEWWGLGVFWNPSGGFSRWSTVKKQLSSKEHLDWLKIDFDAAQIITIPDYTKKINANVSARTQC